MDRDNYIHCRQNEAYEDYREGVTFQEDVEKFYDENDYKMKLPDLLGKTVRVSEKQFPGVSRMVEAMAGEAGIKSPAVYVYEDYYYGAESYGISSFWTEISAKTIQDFTDEELRFVLAREIYKIADGVAKQRTMMEVRFKGIRQVVPVVSGQAEKISRLAFYHWHRLANYSADNYGYLMCGSVKSSIDAILKMVLNSVMLAGQVDVREFIGQASEINRLDDTVFNDTKADEPVPYAPHRIQSLLAYAVSERGIEARKEMERICGN